MSIGIIQKEAEMSIVVTWEPNGAVVEVYDLGKVALLLGEKQTASVAPREPTVKSQSKRDTNNSP